MYGIAVNTVGCRSYEYAVIVNTYIKREGGRKGEREEGREETYQKVEDSNGYQVPLLPIFPLDERVVPVLLIQPTPFQ